MNTKEVKSQVRKSAERVDDAVKAAAVAVGNGAEALGKDDERDELLDRLREIGQGLLERATALSDEASRQARLRPLAVFGIAFVAGVIAARALRRRPASS